MRRRWFIASWLLIALGAIFMAGIMYRDSAGKAAAATQRFGPKEAEVTIEGGVWKTVHLTASKFQWKFRDDQQPVEVWGFNGQIPGPTLRFKAGDHVRVYFTNKLDEASSIQWRGLAIPSSMNGVPGITVPPVLPGETLVYQFTVPNTPGTFSYRAQMDDQLQVGSGLGGAFIIDPRDISGTNYDQDRTVVFSDVAGHHLINGKEFPNVDPWLVRQGDTLLVRMINLSASESHPMYFAGHLAKEITRDGIDLSGSKDPPPERTVRLAPGETVDVVLTMNAIGRGAWLFQSADLSQVTGPDPKSLNIALSMGGDVIPVIYTDSLNYNAIAEAVRAAFKAVVVDTPTPKPTPKPATPQATSTPSAAGTPSAPSPAASGTPQAAGTSSAASPAATGTPQATASPPSSTTPPPTATGAATTPQASATP